VDNIGQQAQNLAVWYQKKKRSVVSAMKQSESDLCYGPETAKAEEAVKMLGSLLGLRAERPDKKQHTGPDVVWIGQGTIAAWGFELKTNKQPDAEYCKDDIGQCHDHAQWLFKQHGEPTALAIMGRTLRVSASANPAPTLRVIEVDALRDLLSRVQSMFEAVDAGDKTHLPQAFQNWLDYYGLNWPSCVEALDSRLAVDLRNND